MVPGDRLDYFGIAGKTTEELKKQGYIVWLPVQASGSWLGEGDNHTFMNMPANGLRAHEKGSYGGWGGREVEGNSGMDFSMSDTSTNAITNALSAANTKKDIDGGRPYPNFFPQAQRDFSARLKWSVTPKFKDANHEPIVNINGPLTVLAAAGDVIKLNGTISDPDRDSVDVRWWQFHTGSYKGEVIIADPGLLKTRVAVPKEATAGQTIHIVLEATDKGTPALTRYQRVIIVIKNK